METVDIVIQLTDKLRALETENASLKLWLHNVVHSLHDYRDLRKQKGLTLREVENITGISNAYLSQLETGKIKSPSHDTVCKLLNLYWQ